MQHGPLTSAPARRNFWIVVTLVALIALWWLAKLIPHTLAIFGIAAFVAFGARPVVTRLEQWRFPKWAAISVIYLVLVCLGAIVLLVVIPMAIDQARSLIANVPLYGKILHGWVMGMRSMLEQRFPTLQIPSVQIAQSSAQGLGGFASGAVSSIGTFVVDTATWVFVAFAAIVVSVYLLLNDDKIVEGFTMLFPVGRRSTARKIVAEVTEVFGHYIFGQLVVSAITGIVIALITAAVGFKYWLIIGLISAIAYAIPMIGMLIAQIIALVLSAPQGGWMMLWVQLIMFTVARVSDMILVPKIMGSSIGVSPIGVMFAVFAGGELFGFWGLIFGIPAAALIKILWRYLGASLYSSAVEGSSKRAAS
jgi:predicted PurR-regulated permease PerM